MKTALKNNNISLVKLRSYQSGYNLIEVMIAAFLLSFAILGLVGLQMLGMKGTHQSLMKQQAMGLVQNITERIRANREGLPSYEFDSATVNCGSALPDCSASNCSAMQIAKVDINNLVCGYGATSKTSALKMSSAGDDVVLVNGSLKVECMPAGNCASGDIRITVGWTERELGQETVSLRQETNTSDSLMLVTRIGK